MTALGDINTLLINLKKGLRNICVKQKSYKIPQKNNLGRLSTEVQIVIILKLGLTKVSLPVIGGTKVILINLLSI